MMVSDSYRELVETASFDWLVAEAVRLERVLSEHSANEIKLAFLQEHARGVYGQTFDIAVTRY